MLERLLGLLDDLLDWIVLKDGLVNSMLLCID